MASEEKSFENVDGRMTDACLYYKLTYEPSAQVSWQGNGDCEGTVQYTAITAWNFLSNSKPVALWSEVGRAMSLATKKHLQWETLNTDALNLLPAVGTFVHPWTLYLVPL